MVLVPCLVVRAAGHEMLKGLNILLGVSGGVAAYKVVGLASKLTAAGARVKTVMTENACRLIGPKSFEAVTRSSVFTSLWENHDLPSVPDGQSELQAAGQEPRHISLVDWADIVIVAPATANIIGKVANGICDDLLSTILCACWPLIESGAAFVVPAMNNNMWNNPAVQRNVGTMKEMGFELIGPVEGRLACGAEAIGRMAEPEDILEVVERISSKIVARDR